MPFRQPGRAQSLCFTDFPCTGLWLFLIFNDLFICNCFVIQTVFKYGVNRTYCTFSLFFCVVSGIYCCHFVPCKVTRPVYVFGPKIPCSLIFLHWYRFRFAVQENCCMNPDVRTNMLSFFPFPVILYIMVPKGLIWSRNPSHFLAF